VYAFSVKKTIDVLHILGTAQPEGSGIAKIVSQLAAHLDPKYNLHAWFLKSDGPLVAELGRYGIAARWVGWERGARDPLGAFRFWQQLRSKEFAIVHQHWGARSIRRLARSRTNAKMLVHCHNRLLEKNGPAAVEGADAIVAVSEFVARQLSHNQVQVVYSGVEPSKHNPRSDRGNAIVIGTASRLIEAKGIRILVSAFADLHKEFPSLRLEIAGSGPEEPYLVHTAQERGVAHAVRFLGWVDNIRPVLRIWDIFALPSFDEALPIAALEAMAESLPVVATRVGGIPELVEDEHTGHLVEPGDTDALQTALRRLINNPELRKRLGDRGRMRAETKFSVQRMAADIQSIYESLLTHP
jgi:glycosyltransferase involved in cell wall biosynthesis